MSASSRCAGRSMRLRWGEGEGGSDNRADRHGAPRRPAIARRYPRAARQGAGAPCQETNATSHHSAAAGQAAPAARFGGLRCWTPLADDSEPQAARRCAAMGREGCVCTRGPFLCGQFGQGMARQTFTESGEANSPRSRSATPRARCSVTFELMSERHASTVAILSLSRPRVCS